jgi:putative holliday junction resolvase
VNEPAPAEGRILALDLGRKRIGLAISDELGITAQGLLTLERTNLRQDLAQLARLIAERGVTLILLGNPLHMSGREGRQ